MLIINASKLSIISINISKMKNILMMILGVGLALGAAAAQPKLANGGRLVGGEDRLKFCHSELPMVTIRTV